MNQDVQADNFFYVCARHLIKSELTEVCVFASIRFTAAGGDGTDELLENLNKVEVRKSTARQQVAKDFQDLPISHESQTLFKLPCLGYIGINGIYVTFDAVEVGQDCARILFFLVDVPSLILKSKVKLGNSSEQDC